LARTDVFSPIPAKTRRRTPGSSIGVTGTPISLYDVRDQMLPDIA